MSQIRHIHIKNFRVIHELEWLPKPGLILQMRPHQVIEFILRAINILYN